MAKDLKTEREQVEANARENPGKTSERRDATMSGGERGAADRETAAQSKTKNDSGEAPIIQRPPEGGVE